MPYYAGFMPGIISLLREATSPDLAVLRGKAMECTGLIGEAVGVQVFAADAMEIMQLFMNALVSTSLHSTVRYVGVKSADTDVNYINTCCVAPGHGAGHHFRLYSSRLCTHLPCSYHAVRALPACADGTVVSWRQAGDPVHYGGRRGRRH